MGHVEGVDLARAEGLVVAGEVVEGGEREVVEDEVAVERVGVEPELVAEADPGHVRARRGGSAAAPSARRPPAAAAAAPVGEEASPTFAAGQERGV